MLPTHHSLRIGNEHDRLRVVDDHRRALDDVADLEPVEQEHRCFVHPPHAVKIHRVRRVCGGAFEGRVFLQRTELLEDGGPECVECLADATNLFFSPVDIKSEDTFLYML